MATGGKLRSSLVLLMALLAMFATATAARSDPTVKSLNKEIMRAFGVGVSDPDACCMCACTLMWPPEINKCVCGGEWSGKCPSVCKSCHCDEDNMCTCQDGFSIWYNDCVSNSCPYGGAAGSGGAHIRL